MVRAALYAVPRFSSCCFDGEPEVIGIGAAVTRRLPGLKPGDHYTRQLDARKPRLNEPPQEIITRQWCATFRREQRISGQ